MQSAGLPEGEADSCELSIVDPQGNWVQMMHTGQGGGIPGVAIDGVWMDGNSADAKLSSSIAGWTTGGGRLKCIVGNALVMRDGRPWIALGTPGRPHLTVPQVLHNILDFGMDPYEASDQVRLWPLADDYSVEVENRISQDVVRGLTRMDIRVKPLGTYRWNMGSFQICWQDATSGQSRAAAILDEWARLLLSKQDMAAFRYLECGRYLPRTPASVPCQGTGAGSRRSR